MFSSGLTHKAKNLYKTGWSEDLNTYTDFGKLILGYYNTDEEERGSYFKILKNLPRDDVVKSHIMSCYMAADLKNYPEDYGEFGEVFVQYYKENSFLN